MTGADKRMTGLRERAYIDLCRTYDGLLEPGGPAASDEMREELAAYARVMDVEVAEADATELWRRLRPVLAAAFGEDGGRLAVEAAGEAAPKIYLPSVRSKATLAGGQEPLSVLVVEDDPDLGPAIVEALTEAGHRVVAHAVGAEAAASHAAVHDVDLAIVDVELAQDTNGDDLARLLHERWGIPALFISGGRNDHLLGREHAVGFLGKPFKLAELLAAVTLATPLLRAAEVKG